MVKGLKGFLDFLNAVKNCFLFVACPKSRSFKRSLILVLLVKISLYFKIKFKRELEAKEKLSLSNEIAANTDETDSQETNESWFIKSNCLK